MFISSYWQFNYNAPGQAGFFLQTHVRPTVECLKFQILFLRCQKRKLPSVENVVFFSKPSIVIKLPVINMNLKFCSTSGSHDNQAFQACNMCHCLSTLNQSIPAGCRVLYVPYPWLSSTRRFLNMELSLLLHQCQKLIYRSAGNLLLEVQSQFT